MLLNTNVKPTYHDIRILAGILALSGPPVHIFRAEEGVFALFAAPRVAEARRIAIEAGHVGLEWLETVSR